MTGVEAGGAAPTATSGVRFCLLGRLEAFRDGVPVDLGPPKQHAVLAVLLLNANRVVATERLIDELWGDSPPETARSALQVYVAGLRKALGNGGATLRTAAPGYVLELERGACDLDRFSELVEDARAAADAEQTATLLHEALALWHDAPLAGLDAEPFASAAVPQLEQLRLDALEERIDADLELGRHVQLVSELEALVVEHPYRERPRAQLMLALYRSHRQAEALQVYRDARRVLRDELGLEPGHELRELEAAILRQDASLDLPVGGAGSNGSALPAPPPVAVTGAARRSRLLGPRGLLLVAGVVAVAAVAAAALLARHSSSGLPVPPNSVAVIDAGSNDVVDALPLPPRPGPITQGAGSVWVGNLEDRTLTRSDARTRRILKTIVLPAAPTGIAFGFHAVWVAHGLTGQLSRIDPQFNRVTRTIDLAGRALYSPTGSVAAGGRWVWVVFGNSVLARVDPVTLRKSGSTLAGSAPSAIAVSGGSVWVANSGDSNVQRFDPTTFEEGPLTTITVGRTPSALAPGATDVWVALTGDDQVARIDAGDNAVSARIDVGDKPGAVAVGAGAVWVANGGDATVSRIEPRTNGAAAEIRIGSAPRGLAVVGGAVVDVTVQAP